VQDSNLKFNVNESIYRAHTALKVQEKHR
jgi:hypothetical protein